MTTAQLTTMIERFDYAYAYCDNDGQYQAAKQQEKEIFAALETITADQAAEIFNSLRHEYFKTAQFGKVLASMMPAPTPEPTPEPQTEAPKKNSKKVALFQNAWTMFKAGLFNSFAEALKAAWQRLKVTNGLKSGVLTFVYIKTDGSIRKATGTLTGLNYEAKGSQKQNIPQVVKYFDLEAQSFRSFRIDRFIGLVA